tara:strand:- start:737 stop:1045 length:309 start_codon:yes stop_codon:yes gene_type:complete
MKKLIPLMLLAIAVSCSKKEAIEEPVDYLDGKCFIITKVNKNDETCASKFTLIFHKFEEYAVNNLRNPIKICVHEDYLDDYYLSQQYHQYCNDIYRFEKERP